MAHLHWAYGVYAIVCKGWLVLSFEVLQSFAIRLEEMVVFVGIAPTTSNYVGRSKESYSWDIYCKWAFVHHDSGSIR